MRNAKWRRRKISERRTGREPDVGKRERASGKNKANRAPTNFAAASEQWAIAGEDLMTLTSTISYAYGMIVKEQIYSAWRETIGRGNGNGKRYP